MNKLTYINRLIWTNSEDNDDDGDRIPDDWEDIYGFHPLDDSDARRDKDGDGYNNYIEYKKGTDPRDKSDYPGKDEEGGNKGSGFINNLTIISIIIIIALFLILTIGFIIYKRKQKREKVIRAPAPMAKRVKLKRKIKSNKNNSYTAPLAKRVNSTDKDKKVLKYSDDESENQKDKTVDKLVNEGNKAYDNGEIEKALGIYEYALTIDQGNEDIKSLKELSLTKLNELNIPDN